MPTKRVKDSERRRCTRACENCKRRKERCDGFWPCRRCVERGVEGRCRFASPDQTRWRRAEERQDSPHQLTSTAGSQDEISRSSPGFEPCADDAPSIDHEESMRFPATADTRWRRSSVSSASASLLPSTSHSSVTHLARLLRDGRGKLTFIGDAANLSFLQIIRRLAHEAVGPCAFVDDPLRHHLVEAAPEKKTNWITSAVANPATKPTLEDAAYLVHWYNLSANSVLNVFCPSSIATSVAEWIETHKDPSRDDDDDELSASFFLVLAIGAQACPEDRDDIADRYLNYGRYLAASNTGQEPSIATVRTHVLISMYLLSASRRNSAYMALGTAVHTAYALGIHRSDVGVYFSAEEAKTRAQVWTSVRILDTFMSTSLGRPQATFSEPRARGAAGPGTRPYSAANHLCDIFHSILTDVYAMRKLLSKDLENISEQHRLWAARLPQGLVTDNIKLDTYVSMPDGTRQFNVGLFHLRQAYYWSIMLLSRPFLIENVAKHISSFKQGLEAGTTPREHSGSASDQVLVNACVDSAVRTVDLLEGLLSEPVPKRMPFVVNCIFISSLVLGLASFYDLEIAFPLSKSLELSHKLLRKLGAHDTIARRDASIVETLQAACELYREQRAQRRMDSRRTLVSGLFGSVHGNIREVGGGEKAATTPQLQTRTPTAQGTMTIESQCSFTMDGQTLYEDGSAGHTAVASDLGSLPANTIALSPRALFFDSFDQFMPMYPTVDASWVQAHHEQDGGGF